MNEFMTNLLGLSWRSTLGGIIAAMPQALQAAAMGAGVTLNKWVIFAGLLVSAVGMLVGFSNTKDRQVSSTAAEVQAATEKAHFKGLADEVDAATPKP